MRLLVFIVVFLLTLPLSACGESPTPRDTPANHHVPKDRPMPQRQSGGLGMTYSGKIGIELAPGIIMTPSGPGLGFGF